MTGRRRDGTHVPAPPVGRRDVDRRRAQVHRHAPRSQRARCGSTSGCGRARRDGVGHRVRRRRHHRDRRAWADRSIQSGGRAAVRVRGARVVGPQRQHADAVAVSRRARYLSGTISRDRRAEDHRHRPGGHRPAPGRHDVSAAPVGRRDDGGRRATIHRHPARSQRAGARSRSSCANRRRWRGSARWRP